MLHFTAPSVSGVVKAVAEYPATGILSAYGYSLSGASLNITQVLLVNYYYDYKGQLIYGTLRI
ncbi:MAG: hypothetical protein LBT25_03955 [Candidatus Symbiothrix sp.]|jgi:hypothetical protein|nr:hypothetical protein [Candidatus Symbiothrix sp.]